MTPNGLGQGHVTHFTNFGSRRIFVIGKARHFRFGMHIDIDE